MKRIKEKLASYHHVAVYVQWSWEFFFLTEKIVLQLSVNDWFSTRCCTSWVFFQSQKCSSSWDISTKYFFSLLLTLFNVKHVSRLLLSPPGWRKVAQAVFAFFLEEESVWMLLHIWVYTFNICSDIVIFKRYKCVCLTYL